MIYQIRKKELKNCVQFAAIKSPAIITDSSPANRVKDSSSELYRTKRRILASRIDPATLTNHNARGALTADSKSALKSA